MFYSMDFDASTHVSLQVPVRIAWEVHLVEEALKIPGIIWPPSEESVEELLRTTMDMDIPLDCRGLVEMGGSETDWQ